MLLKQTLALCAATILMACAGDGVADQEQQSGEFSGPTMTPARPKPNFTFTKSDGTPYDLRRETDGKLTYLFFGYTYCPDVCPLHMANIAAVYKKLSYAQQQEIRVVFVTTDPDRDTPERLRTWLNNFHASFIGVAGEMGQVNALQQSMGLPPAVQEKAPEGGAPLPGAYGVAHSAVVLAFTPDDSLRVLYPFGTRQADFAKDVPRLLRYKGRG